MAASFKGCGPHPKRKDWANGFAQPSAFWVCRTSSTQLNFMPPCIMQRENRFWFSTSGRGSSALGADTPRFVNMIDSGLAPAVSHTHTHTSKPHCQASASAPQSCCRFAGSEIMPATSVARHPRSSRVVTRWHFFRPSTHSSHEAALEATPGRRCLKDHSSLEHMRDRSLAPYGAQDHSRQAYGRGALVSV